MGLTRTSLEGLSRRVADMGITAVTPTELTALTDTGSAVGVSHSSCDRGVTRARKSSAADCQAPRISSKDAVGARGDVILRR